VTKSARLYRSMVPTSPVYDDPSIVFLGHFGTRDTMIVSEARAL
jgi:dimethylaniline monooxygenase (N-oxide forming)